MPARPHDPSLRPAPSAEHEPHPDVEAAGASMAGRAACSPAPPR